MQHLAGYGHHLRTPPTDELTTILQLVEQKFATFQHLDMSRCWALALRCGKFVVEYCFELVRWWCPLVVLYNMAVAGVRVVECGPNDKRRGRSRRLTALR